MGFEVFPKGLYKVLKKFKEYKGIQGYNYYRNGNMP